MKFYFLFDGYGDLWFSYLSVRDDFVWWSVLIVCDLLLILKLLMFRFVEYDGRNDKDKYKKENEVRKLYNC